MVRTTQRVVDILRRVGPGTLSADRLRAELRRYRPAIVMRMEGLRLLVEESRPRLMLLEVRTDPLVDDEGTRPLESWIILMDPEDAPSRNGLAHRLWEGLAALAAELDPTCRISVSRWMIKAERARRLCAADRR